MRLINDERQELLPTLLIYLINLVMTWRIFRFN
jgi:hypothetical protein